MQAAITETSWVIESRYRRRRWEIIVEPDFDVELLVVITAYSMKGI